MILNENSPKTDSVVKVDKADSTEKQKKKPYLLIFAHYYHPDVASTGQILKELAEGILDSFHITVICVVPSYGGTVELKYQTKKYYYEKINGVNIIRVRVPEFDKTNKVSRVRNITTYFCRAIWAMLKIKDVDYVYSISQPPIFGGLLGVIAKRIKHSKFIYNIQDFNPEQVLAVNYSKNLLILKAMMALDKLSCKQSDKVIVVGRDMVETLKNRFKGKPVPTYAFINNWIDEKEIYPLELTDSRISAFKEKYNLKDKFVFMYSGNIGLYYDLENLIRVIEKFPADTKTPEGKDVIFAFVGDGSIRDKLYMYSRECHMENVVFIPYQNKVDLNYSLNAADVHWCVSASRIKGTSVPSKLYGELATSRPIIGILEIGAEARLIMEETQCGLVSDPGDYGHVEMHIDWFINHAADNELVAMGTRGRRYLVEKLTKDISIKKYVQEILNC